MTAVLLLAFAVGGLVLAAGLVITGLIERLVRRDDQRISRRTLDHVNRTYPHGS